MFKSASLSLEKKIITLDLHELVLSGLAPQQGASPVAFATSQIQYLKKMTKMY